MCVCVQAGAENVMRNVAKRMLMGDVARCVISWKMKVLEMLNQKRGEGIMKRVGLRMLNKDLSISFCNWRDNQLELKNRLRGEQIMRRVGARMMKKELTQNWDAWVKNYKENMLEMVSRRWLMLDTACDCDTVYVVMSSANVG